VLLGGNGQSFGEIIREINTFTEDNKELIILNLSRDVNADKYRRFNQDEWDQLLGHLTGDEGLNHLFVAPNPREVDLSTLPLNQFIGTNQAAVLIIVEPQVTSITLDEYHHRGAYYYKQMNAIYEHTRTHKLDDMINRQLRLLRNNRPSPNSSLFLLSWTHRHSGKVLIGPSVLKLSVRTLSRIYTDLFPECSKDTYPNILFLDGLENSNITALAMAINDIATVPDRSNIGQFNPRPQTSIRDCGSGNSVSDSEYSDSDDTASISDGQSIQSTQQGNDGMSLCPSIVRS